MDVLNFRAQKYERVLLFGGEDARDVVVEQGELAMKSQVRIHGHRGRLKVLGEAKGDEVLRSRGLGDLTNLPAVREL
jgi:hypothetical protein